MLIALQAFLGQRHGSRFFPPIISSDEFTALRTFLQNNGHDVDALDTWCREDENAIPHVYVLQPVSSRLPDFLSGVSSVAIFTHYVMNYGTHMYVDTYRY